MRGEMDNIELAQFTRPVPRVELLFAGIRPEQGFHVGKESGDLLDFARTSEICLGYDLGTICSVGLEEVVGTSVPDSVSSLSQV